MHALTTFKPRFEAASKSATLELLLPISKDVDFSSLFGNEGDEPLAKISTRQALYFDESVNVIVVLKTAVSGEDIKNLLPGLELRLAAHATEAVLPDSGGTSSTSGKYDLVSTSFRANEDAAIFSTRDSVYVLWTASLHVARPRVRIQRAAIYFTTTLTVHPDVTAGQDRQSGHLRAFEPLPSNVLEPLQWDPSLTKSGIYLPETRVTKVAPRTSPIQHGMRPIRETSKRAIPAIPAVFSRIRYSSVISDAIIASLHVESSRLLPGPVAINGIEFEVATSRAQGMVDVQWPVLLQPGDELVVLYRLPTMSRSGKDSQPLRDNTSSVSVAIDASMSLEHGSDIEIRVGWQTQVDLSMTNARPSYRWSRSLSVSSYRSSHMSGASYSRPTSYNALVSKGDDLSVTTFTFTGLQAVQQNQTFKLAVHCNNRCHRARRFALVMVPNRKHRSSKKPRMSSTSDDLNRKIFHQLVSDETQPPDVLDMNADVRIGPFSPGTCFQTSIKFRAANIGALSLGTVRIIDLESRQVVDVRELPDVIAIDGPVKSE